MTAGDLTREAPVTTQDEVGVLATAFNTMTAELRETLEGLEQRVADRTEELRLQNAELGALHETTLGVMHRLDVDDLLRELLDARVRAARRRRTGTSTSAARMREELENRVATGVFEEELGARMSLGEGLAGRVWQSGDAARGRGLRLLGGPHGRRSRAAASARSSACRCSSGADAIGALGVARDGSDERPFEASEVERLQRFAQLASIALDNARLYALGAARRARPPTRRTLRRARSSRR